MKSLLSFCIREERKDLIHIFKKLQFIKTNDCKPTSFHQHVLQLGYIVVFLVKHIPGNIILEHSSNGHGYKTFMVIVSIDGIDDAEQFSFVTMFNNITPNLFSAQNPSKGNVQLLKLTHNVRKLAHLHACNVDGGCNINRTQHKQNLEHSKTPLDDGHFYVIDQENVYPPRRS